MSVKSLRVLRLLPVLLAALATGCAPIGPAPTGPVTPASPSETSAPPPASPSATSALPAATQRPAAGAVEVAEAAGARDTSPMLSPGDQAQLVAANGAFAFALYDALRGQPGNLFFSPYSISSALAMTYAGARGATEKQMADTLRWGAVWALPQARLHPAFDALDLALASHTQISNSFQLTVANSLWGQQGHPFLQSFLTVLRQNYGAGLLLLDFQDAPDPSRRTINAWVANNTQGKITDLIPSGAIDSSTRLVLANALYFKAKWMAPFDRNATSNQVFHLLDGSQVTVPMMEQVTHLSYAEGTGYQVVDLPYAGGQVSMVILLPRAGQLDALEKGLAAGAITPTLQSLGTAKVDLTLPKFKYGSSFSLGQTLQGMGMRDAFSPSAADFSGMDGHQHDLFISDVIHKALVAVDEDGTEAAAATAVAMSSALAAAPIEKIVQFKADHPFIYVIRDDPTGTILFLGRVEDPSKG